METKHTPGPWNIHFNDTGHATSIRADHHICVMRTNNRDECNANAKLIAAAPDLLDALDGMIKMYEAIEPAGGWQGVYECAVAACKKATK